MNVNEKILLVQLLLEDIRGNWGGVIGTGCDALARAEKASSLCEEIANELHNDDYLALASSCNTYIAGYFYDNDGRWFRYTFPKGYIGMDKLHGLEHTYEDKSNEFKFVADEYLTFPEYRFEDWKERFND